MSNDLQPAEAERLEHAEATIKKGIRTFLDVGNALARIRDERLYRAEYSTFESYCRERWGLSRSRAHRLIEAAEVVEMLPIGNTPAITNEGQAREVARIIKRDGAEAAAAVLKRASASGTVTASALRAIASEMFSEPPEVTELIRRREELEQAEAEQARRSEVIRREREELEAAEEAAAEKAAESEHQAQMQSECAAAIAAEHLTVHPLLAKFPHQTRAEMSALIESIQQVGVQQPVVITDDLVLLDGRQRLIAAARLGIRWPARVVPREVEQSDWVLVENLLGSAPSEDECQHYQKEMAGLLAEAARLRAGHPERYVQVVA